MGRSTLIFSIATALILWVKTAEPVVITRGLSPLLPNELVTLLPNELVTLLSNELVTLIVIRRENQAKKFRNSGPGDRAVDPAENTLDHHPKGQPKP